MVRCVSAAPLGPILAACVLALLPITASSVSAHPLGNFTVNRYSRVEVRGDGIHIRYVLDLAEIPSVQETQLADLNHDGVVSSDEWGAYKRRRLEEIRANLELTVDGTPVQLQLEDPDNSSLSTPIGQADIPLIRIEAWFRAGWEPPQQDTSSHSATFRDRNEPARLGWREIVVRGDQSMSVSNASVPTIDTTDELRSYPERFLQDPLDVREAHWIFAPGRSKLPVTPVPQGGGAGRPVDPFTALVTAADLNLGVVLLALAGAAALGGIHAASPGHGKTVMAAYIVGTRGGFLHAVVLGLSVTVSHTFGVLVLGAITLLASNLILPERLYPWLTMVAALIVLVLGMTLLVGAVRGLGREQSAHQHAHDHDHTHTHTHEHEHEHGHEHEHAHERKLPITWRSLFMLGLAGGIVPSASALVVLLSALALGRLGFGLLLILAFGFGMAVVLITTGVLLVTASRFMSRYFPDDAHSPLQRLFARSVPLLSAGIMVLIGVIATLQALGQFGILAFF